MVRTLDSGADDYLVKPFTTAQLGARVRAVLRRVGEPPALDLVRVGDLEDLKVFSLLPMQHASRTILAPHLLDKIHPFCWFLTAYDRDLVKKGLNYFVPNEFHQIPRLIRDFMEIDVTVTTVSPMDQAGFFSFGTVNDYISTAARHCKKLIVEVNRHMPRVLVTPCSTFPKWMPSSKTIHLFWRSPPRRPSPRPRPSAASLRR